VTYRMDEALDVEMKLEIQRKQTDEKNSDLISCCKLCQSITD